MGIGYAGMSLEIGKLYAVMTTDDFYIKPHNLEQLEKDDRLTYYTTWDIATAYAKDPNSRLFGQYILFVGSETIGKIELDKFLWNNKFIYSRSLSKIEFEYRLEEVEQKDET